LSNQNHESKKIFCLQKKSKKDSVSLILTFLNKEKKIVCELSLEGRTYVNHIKFLKRHVTFLEGLKYLAGSVDQLESKNCQLSKFSVLFPQVNVGRHFA